MADFDLTQTDQQVQNILNDAQGAMGASAQTTLTTEYVMLKDTSGVYHKILKSSFTEAIRDVLAGLLVNNDKGTTINQIAAIASGDFGSITPANLASVLGVGFTNFNVAAGETAIIPGLVSGGATFDLLFDGNRYAIYTYYVAADGTASAICVTTSPFSDLIEFSGDTSRRLYLKNKMNRDITFAYRMIRP